VVEYSFFVFLKLIKTTFRNQGAADGTVSADIHMHPAPDEPDLTYTMAERRGKFPCVRCTSQKRMSLG